MRSLAVLLLLLAAQRSSGFPLFSSSNGSIHLKTSFGGNLYLAPAAGGAVTSRALLRAQGG
jgi:hypothetical protein